MDILYVSIHFCSLEVSPPEKGLETLAYPVDKEKNEKNGGKMRDLLKLISSKIEKFNQWIFRCCTQADPIQYDQGGHLIWMQWAHLEGGSITYRQPPNKLAYKKNICLY